MYDAALIEMVLQGLDLIAFCAQRFNKQEVNFMLSPYEADHLTALKTSSTPSLPIPPFMENASY
ncbi:hypothetical protein [Candidatus Odyssella acanthamoebae]|uniref:Uncharacterized protein n=1 Tax=Candidatus Odyssella acanthamoebae TaxID=91604 RepID=A0A077ATD5_9PROT|nr:hypothetical protein [Candidatus Paracaedibacter acanthamoebae]AIK96422.1 hypothetical protein ID47_06230 [Candidatus Paracaedibacter acanthamoebae]